MCVRAFSRFLALAGMLAAAHSFSWAEGGVRIPADGKPFKLLSEYGFFADGARQVPAPRVVPYDVVTPLFSDYTVKRRFVWTPEGTAAAYAPDGPFDFPPGSVLIKTFSSLHDLRDPAKGETLIETRLLLNGPEGWIGWSYVWNAEQTEAALKLAGGRTPLTWIHTDGSERTINYIIPNINQCKGCHIRGETMAPIGPKASNLNRSFAYPGGEANQLVHWAEIGLLTGAPDPGAAPRMPVWDDPSTGTLDARARAYLDVNCAHCHSPGGPGNTSGLDLRYEQPNPYDWGVLRAPVAAGRGAGDRDYDIVPGHPEASILVHRMESVEPGVMMPELPRLTVHDEGVALIREWIAAMKSDG